MFVFLLPFAIAGTAHGDGAGPAVFAENAPSVVKIEHGWRRSYTQGSGIVIAKGLVVTNCHVMQRAQLVSVISKGVRSEARLMYEDTNRDLCLVQAPGLTAPAIAAIAEAVPATGASVFAIGAPLGLDLTLSQGIVSSLRDIPYGKLIQTTAAISPGSSGGGLFDEQGTLVGITTAQARQGQSLNFAVPVSTLREWVDAFKKATYAAKHVVGSARFPPHLRIEVPSAKRGSGGRKSEVRPLGGSGIRLTSNFVAAPCSAIGVTTTPARTPSEFYFWHGIYISPTSAESIHFIEAAKDVCVGSFAAGRDDTIAVSIGTTSTVGAGDAVFAFADPRDGVSIDLGMVETTHPAEPGFGHQLSIKTGRLLPMGTGVFSVEGKLLGMISGYSSDRLAEVTPVEALLAALETAAAKASSGVLHAR